MPLNLSCRRLGFSRYWNGRHEVHFDQHIWMPEPGDTNHGRGRADLPVAIVWQRLDCPIGYLSISHGIHIANGLDLGLAAAVWTNDLSLAHKTAEALEAGYVWINDSSRHYFGTPFGGYKNSALGREESAEELSSYLEFKVVHTRMISAHQALDRILKQT